MKKVAYQEYGNPDVLEVIETNRPVISKSNKIIVKIAYSQDIECLRKTNY